MPRVSKLNKWFKHYTDETNPGTFMNGTGSSKAAKYKANSELAFAVIGSQNLRKLKDRMSDWMEETGMSENSLHTKFLQLKNAKEIKFIKIKGYIANEDLPDGVTALGTTGLVVEKEGKNGKMEKKFTAGDTLIEIKTDALAIQQKILDMGYKIKGSYKPEEINLNAKIKGLKIEFIKPGDLEEDE